MSMYVGCVSRRVCGRSACLALALNAAWRAIDGDGYDGAMCVLHCAAEESVAVNASLGCLGVALRASPQAALRTTRRAAWDALAKQLSGLLSLAL